MRTHAAIESQAFTARFFEHTDSSAVIETLDFLPVLYPSGVSWLRKTLREISIGDANCVVITHNEELIAIAVGKPKSSMRYKVSTLYVKPEYRSRGLGDLLMRHMHSCASNSGARTIYITAAHTVAPLVERVAISNAMTCVVTQLNRYGQGRHETVFEGQVSP